MALAYCRVAAKYNCQRCQLQQLEIDCKHAQQKPLLHPEATCRTNCRKHAGLLDDVICCICKERACKAVSVQYNNELWLLCFGLQAPLSISLAFAQRQQLRVPAGSTQPLPERWPAGCHPLFCSPLSLGRSL